VTRIPEDGFDNLLSSETARKVKTTSRLRGLLFSPELEFICEAHNGLSAKIVEAAGFDGIWASGLTIAGQFGVRDNNEVSWTQVLDMLEFMSDAVSIPILMDGDTGYGNFNNVQRLVRKLEQCSIAGVCIEDKLFPKTNSFIDGALQSLADIDEFCGKIKAGKDAQTDPDFCIVARVEAFIAGWGLDEALRRAEAYHRAGADAILIHSARSDPSEVLSFKKEWSNRSPVVIVPTTYYSAPTELFEEYDFSLVVWANHLMRAAIPAMRRTADRIKADRSVVRVEDEIAPVKELFRLQGADDLRDAEQLYLPRAKRPTAIVLAAGRGDELYELTMGKPKTMIPINGQPLLASIVSTYNASGIRDIVVVRGYKKEMVTVSGVRYADNDEHSETGELISLSKGTAAVSSGQDLIVGYGDVLFRKFIVELLIDAEDDLVAAIDIEWQNSTSHGRLRDYAKCTTAYSRHHYNRAVYVEQIAGNLLADEINGEWMGFLRISAKIVPVVAETLQQLILDPANRKASMATLINELIKNGHKVRAIYTSGNWCDVDTLEDVVDAGSF
jgi:phosphoenolpyruvate phosphomutase